MQHLWSHGKMAIILLAACLSAPLPAGAETPLAQVLDTTTLTIPVPETRQAGPQPPELKIPVSLNPAIKKTDDLLFQTILVTVDGETRKLAAFQFTLKEIPAPGLGLVKVDIDPQLTATAGKYTVLVLPVRTPSAATAGPKAAPTATTPVKPAPPATKPSTAKKAPAAPDPAPPGDAGAKAAPPAAGNTPASLKFTFDKPPAELRLAPLRITRRVVLPWFGGWLYPSTLVLSETGGKSSLTPEPRDLLIDLSLPDGQALPGRLKLSGLTTIKPWGQLQAQLSTEGWFGLGSAKGTVTIRAPELASRKADFQVELVSRAWLGWLVLILIISIGLGYFTRTVLEKRTKAMVALRAAKEQCGIMQELLNKMVDVDFRNQLTATLTDLIRVIQSKADDPDALTSATTAARQGTEVILGKVKELHDRLAQKIDDWQMALESAGEQAPEVDQAVQQTLAWLAGLEKSLEAGDLHSVEADLTNNEKKRGGLIGQSGGDWLIGLRKSLASAQPWPEIALDADFKAKQESIHGLEEQSTKVDTPQTLGELLTALATLRWGIFSLLYPRGEEIKALAGDILAGLKQKAINADDVQKAHNEFGKALEVKTADGLPALMAAEANLWEALKTTLDKVWKALNKSEELAGLPEGKFRAAWAEIKKTQAEQQLGEGVEIEEPPSLEEKIPTPLAPEPQPSPPPAWRVRIQGPGSAGVGEPLTLELLVTALDGKMPDPVVRWSVLGDPRYKWQGGPGQRSWHFTPLEPGRLVVRAEAEVPGLGTQPGVKQTAELTIEIMPAPGFVEAEELKKRLQNAERIQTIIYGLLITAVGFSIFRSSFMGTFEDVLAAALWGFSIDIGVAKVREFATPLLAKAPKFTIL